MEYQEMACLKTKQNKEMACLYEHSKIQHNHISLTYILNIYISILLKYI